MKISKETRKDLEVKFISKIEETFASLKVTPGKKTTGYIQEIASELTGKAIKLLKKKEEEAETKVSKTPAKSKVVKTKATKAPVNGTKVEKAKTKAKTAAVPEGKKTEKQTKES